MCVSSTPVSVAAGLPMPRRQSRGADVLEFFQNPPRCLAGIEACGTAHHWAREITALGHEVKLLPPSYVKPYPWLNSDT
jgi:transposase